jgi:acyl-CoA reductase-like NAD-dependent aldehyde dehydrogenase
VTGLGEAGAALVACKDIDKIIFTGSPQVSRERPDWISGPCFRSVRKTSIEGDGSTMMRRSY